MTFLTSFNKNNYIRSNSIFEIDFVPQQASKSLTKNLLATQNYEKRQILAEKLLQNLAADAKISQVKLKISSTKQYSRHRNGKIVFKLYGYYRAKNKYIYIQNLTSVQGKQVAAKTFLNTLLHEWLHHYDTEKLGLYSIHTKGFYQRLSSLKKHFYIYKT